MYRVGRHVNRKKKLCIRVDGRKIRAQQKHVVSILHYNTFDVIRSGVLLVIWIPLMTRTKVIRSYRWCLVWFRYIRWVHTKVVRFLVLFMCVVARY